MGTTRRSHAGRAIALAAVLTIGLGACGGPEPTSVGAGSTVPGGSVPTASFVDDPSIVPLCRDVPELGPVREGNHPGPDNPDSALVGTLTAYGAEHPDTFAGFWIDRSHGGTLVLAFTDDPATHLPDVLARRSGPGDQPFVATAVPTSVAGSGGADGGAPIPTATPPATTVGESGWVVDVVQARHPEAELRTLQNRLITEGIGVPDVTLGSSGIATTQNRVNITLDPGDESVRRRLAQRWPADQLCVITVPSPEEAWPPDVPKPSTLIPPADTDPWVTCGSGGMPFPASNLGHHPSLDPADPLAQAFAAAQGSSPSDLFPAPPGAGSYYLLARSTDRALFAAGSPPAGLVTFENKGGRWTWAGSGGGCTAPRALLPPGVGTVDWALDPAFPAPQAGDTVVHLLATEQACRSGQPMGDRLRPPEVVVRGDQVLIGLGATIPRTMGGFTCIGNRAEEVTVTLPEPLGTRTLADGTYVPARPAEQLAAGGIAGAIR